MELGHGCHKTNFCEFYHAASGRCMNTEDTIDKESYSGQPCCPFHPNAISRNEWIAQEGDRQAKKEAEKKKMEEEQKKAKSSKDVSDNGKDAYERWLETLEEEEGYMYYA